MFVQYVPYARTNRTNKTASLFFTVRGSPEIEDPLIISREDDGEDSGQCHQYTVRLEQRPNAVNVKVNDLETADTKYDKTITPKRKHHYSVSYIIRLSKSVFFGNKTRLLAGDIDGSS